MITRVPWKQIHITTALERKKEKASCQVQTKSQHNTHPYYYQRNNNYLHYIYKIKHFSALTICIYSEIHEQIKHQMGYIMYSTQIQMSCGNRVRPYFCTLVNMLNKLKQVFSWLPDVNHWSLNYWNWWY